MSIEIKAKLKGVDVGMTVQNVTETFTPTQTGSAVHQTKQVVGSSTPEALSVGDVDTASDYWIFLRAYAANTDEVNVLVGGDDDFCLKPGEPFLGKVKGGVAVTLSCTGSATNEDVEVLVVEA